MTSVTTASPGVLELYGGPGICRASREGTILIMSPAGAAARPCTSSTDRKVAYTASAFTGRDDTTVTRPWTRGSMMKFLWVIWPMVAATSRMSASLKLSVMPPCSGPAAAAASMHKDASRPVSTDAQRRISLVYIRYRTECFTRTPYYIWRSYRGSAIRVDPGGRRRQLQRHRLGLSIALQGNSDLLGGLEGGEDTHALGRIRQRYAVDRSYHVTRVEAELGECRSVARRVDAVAGELALFLHGH